MAFKQRLRAALFASGIHLSISLLVAIIAAAFVLLIWYPEPYSKFAGGSRLFLLLVVVDVVCGPVLTLVLFNPAKQRTELMRDLFLVSFIQIAALVYGVSSVWHARPLFLVSEVDRFKVIAAPDLEADALVALPSGLKPQFFRGPIAVAIRAPQDLQERQKVLRESILGGRDYAERPEFYIPYNYANALKSLTYAKPLLVFLQKRPDQSASAQKLALDKKADLSHWLYLPIVARQDWVAVLDNNGQIQGFLEGDGF